jgi:glycosyltransferase involved in cell wall biosynthesis
MISVLIPERNETFITETIEGILKSATGEIEIIVNVDEKFPEKMVKDERVTYLHPDSPKGMRYGINVCAKAAKGEYLLKTDAHCLFAEGFDETLLKDMQDNWLVIPRRYSLEASNWTIQQNGKSPRDYHYLCCPSPYKDHDWGMHGVEWPERSRERRDKPEYDIDDTPSFQGSCWLMKRNMFTDFLGGMEEHGYGVFSQEPQEIGNKFWLGGGEIKINKKTWYAHLHKGKVYGRMYRSSQREIIRGHNYSAWYWMNNSWKGQIHPIKWLIQKFPNMPTWDKEWYEDWDAAFAKWHELYPKDAEGIEL